MPTLPLHYGVLVALEGIDGSGKSTQVDRVAEALRGVGLQVETTAEPTKGKWGMELRRSAQEGRLAPERELELFLLDREEHVRTCIQPALDVGAVVLTDRYYFSTIAYQGARGFDRQTLLADNEAIAPRPDLLIILDIPVTLALERITLGRAEDPSAFEEAEMLRACRDIFLDSAERFDSGHVVDGQQSLGAIHMDILRLLIDGPLGSRIIERHGETILAEVRQEILG